MAACKIWTTVQLKLAAILDRIKLESSKLCYSYYFIIIFKIINDLIGFAF